MARLATERSAFNRPEAPADPTLVTGGYNIERRSKHTDCKTKGWRLRLVKLLVASSLVADPNGLQLSETL